MTITSTKAIRLIGVVQVSLPFLGVGWPLMVFKKGRSQMTTGKPDVVGILSPFPQS